MNILLILMIAQGLILSLMLFSRKHYKVRNRLLGGIIFSIILPIMLELMEVYIPGVTKGLWIFPFCIMLLSVPVLFYHYVYAITSNNTGKLKKHLILTAGLGITVALLSILFWGPQSFDEYKDSTFSQLLSLLKCVLWLGVLPGTLSEIRRKAKHNTKVVNYRSWIRTLLVFFLLSMIFEIADDVIEYFHYSLPLDIFTVVDFILLGLIYFVSYKSLARPHMFMEFADEIDKKVAPKYSTSGVSSEKLDFIYTTLKDYVEKEKPYLKGDLSIQELAASINISRQYLSQVLSEKMGCNFNDYINRFRIEEFKKRVGNPEYKDYTLLALAYDSGFNSKTTFNTIFKKHTGMTPSQYRKGLGL